MFKSNHKPRNLAGPVRKYGEVLESTKNNGKSSKMKAERQGKICMILSECKKGTKARKARGGGSLKRKYVKVRHAFILLKGVHELASTLLDSSGFSPGYS
jgi:hypothetical protein